VIAVRDDDVDRAAEAPEAGKDSVRAAWHVVLQPVSYRGSAALAGGARPFAPLPQRGKVAGAAAVITLAGLGPDPARGREFFDRFVDLGLDVGTAPGHCAAIVQAPDERRRLELLDQAWQPGAVYCDPADQVTGRDALAQHIGATQGALAGGRVEITTSPVRHHDAAFFRWTMTDAGGVTVLTGFDVVQLGQDGRIARLSGFFDSDTALP
jgi:hypothetical protein